MYSLNTILCSGFLSPVTSSLKQAGFFGNIIVLVVIVLSCISWAVIGKKWLKFRQINQENKRFLQIYEKAGKDLGRALDAAKQCPNSILGNIFVGGYQELRSLSTVEDGKIVFTQSVLPVIARSLDNSISSHSRHLEDRLVILAVTANICPFLGLLGTVWGILVTFRSMALVGNATIATVAPGVATALITTVVGLAAAIPAATAYNLFSSRLNRFSSEMEDFSSSYLGLLERTLLSVKNRAK